MDHPFKKRDRQVETICDWAQARSGVKSWCRIFSAAGQIRRVEFTQLSPGRHLLVTIVLQVCGRADNSPLNRSSAALIQPQKQGEQMLRNHFVLIAVAAGLMVGTITAPAQDAGALLDLLVKKRLITDQEAEEVRGELTRDAAATAAGKWKISAPITEIELSGDMRVRYEQRQGATPDAMPGSPGPNDTLKRSRERYRLRLGLRGTL